LIVPGTLRSPCSTLIDRISPQLWRAGRPSSSSIRRIALLRALRDRDLSWLLREPYDAAEFRFVVAAALATDDKLDPRSGLRVPISMPVVVAVDGDRRDGFVRNLSIGGAYVALEAPPDAGASVRLALDLGDRPLEVSASVAYSQTTGATGRAVRESGMGVGVPGTRRSRTRRDRAFIGERIGSFRL
jgi:hypothetical protein